MLESTNQLTGVLPSLPSGISHTAQVTSGTNHNKLAFNYTSRKQWGENRLEIAMKRWGGGGCVS